MIIKADESTIEILLVEDDDVDVMNIKRAFKKNEIENPLVIKNNGLEALEYLRDKAKRLPKIVLLDINMPKMNGLEFLDEIRRDERLKSLIVFVMTTSDQDSDRYMAYNLNVAGYILKPLEFPKFVEAVGNLRNYLGTIIFH
jgi:CheY-like chemotaxis protein